MRIAMVSEHASPLAALGGVDAGGQNVHVAALARRWPRAATRSWSTPAATARTCPSASRCARRVDVVHVPAGPAAPLPKDELLPYMRAFGRVAGRATGCDAAGCPTWCTPTSGCPGWPPCTAARTLGVPVVQTFHALGVGQAAPPGRRRHQPGRSGSGTEARLARERRPGRGDLHATRSASWCGSARRASGCAVVPCGVDVEPSPRTGRRPARRGGAARPSGRIGTRWRGGTGWCASGGWSSARASTTAVPGAGRGAATPSSSWPAARPPSELAADPEAQRLRALAARWASPTGCGWSARVGRRRHARAAALGRRRRRHALVRAVRDRPAGGDGVRRAGGRHRGRRAARHRRRRLTGVLVPPRDPAALGAAVRGAARRPGNPCAAGSRRPRAGRSRATAGTGSPPTPRPCTRASPAAAAAPRAAPASVIATGWVAEPRRPAARRAPSAALRAARRHAWQRLGQPGCAELAARRRPAARGRQRRQRRGGPAPDRRAGRPVRDERQPLSALSP